MKKAFSIMLAVMMVFSLVACGSKEAAPAESAAVGEKTEAAAEAKTETADAKGTFKIGGSGPLTGGAALYGIAVQRGGQIAVDEINAAGGINGYQIEWLFEDDEHDAEKAVNAYNNLKDKGLQIMVGTVTSGPCLSVVEETSADNMFEISPSGSTKDITINKNVYRVCYSDPDQGIKSAQYIGEKGLAKKIGIIYDSSDPYSQGIYETFDAGAADYGLEVVAAEAFTADSKSDFTTQIQKMKDAGAELCFLPFYYTEAALVLKQAKEMGYSPLFFGVDGMDGILNLEGFDASLAEGVMLLTPFAADAQDDLTVNFVKAYTDAYGETPIQFAADGYDAVYIVKAAAEAAGITPDMSVSDICDALCAVMGDISIDGLTGKGISFTEDGEPNKDPKAVVIQNGAYVAMD